MAVLVGVVVSISKIGADSQKMILAQDDARVLVQNMANTLNNPISCAKTFGGLDPVAGSPVSAIKDQFDTTQFAPNTVYGNRATRLQSIFIGGPGKDQKTGIMRWQPGTQSNLGTAFVQVQWAQTGSGNSGPALLSRFFMVYVTNINSNNQIVSCTALLGGDPGSGESKFSDFTSVQSDSVNLVPCDGFVSFMIGGNGVTSEQCYLCMGTDIASVTECYGLDGSGAGASTIISRAIGYDGSMAPIQKTTDSGQPNYFQLQKIGPQGTCRGKLACLK